MTSCPKCCDFYFIGPRTLYNHNIIIKTREFYHWYISYSNITKCQNNDSCGKMTICLELRALLKSSCMQDVTASVRGTLNHKLPQSYQVEKWDIMTIKNNKSHQVKDLWQVTGQASWKGFWAWGYMITNPQLMPALVSGSISKHHKPHTWQWGPSVLGSWQHGPGRQSCRKAGDQGSHLSICLVTPEKSHRHRGPQFPHV